MIHWAFVFSLVAATTVADHAAARSRLHLPLPHPDRQDGVALVEIDGFAGACQALTVAGQDRTAECVGKLIATRSADGRAGFYFILRDGSTVAFSAPAYDRSGPAADELEIPVDNLLSGSILDTARTKASGTCDVTDFASAPVWVRCEASEDDGRFSATFLSDRSGAIDLRGAETGDGR